MVIEYPVGNITQIRDGAQQTVYFDNAVVSPDQRFEYDPLYRLTHAEGREHTSLTQPTHADLSFGPQPHPNDPSALRTYEEDYAWDEVGNLVQLQHAASGGSFTRHYVYANANNLSPAGNRLLSNSAPGEGAAPFSHSYTYDAHGNMTAMPHLAAMAWDHADRLQHCDLGGGGDVWFVYDAAGNRVRKVQVNTSGSTVRERIYVGAWEVWRERTGTPLAVEQERQTLHVGDDRGKLALVETLTVDDGDPVATPISIQRHQHGNHLGSASLELDANAAVISYEEFHPFGTSSYAANDSGIEVSAKRYRYIGKERDEETGLYHLGARYYASWLGRWTAADPIGLGGGVNRFAYADGNPVCLTDAAGTAPTKADPYVLTERPGVVARLASGGQTFSASSRELALERQSQINVAASQADEEVFTEELNEAKRAESAAKKAIRGKTGDARDRANSVYQARRDVRKGLEDEYSLGLRGHGTEWASALYDLGNGNYAVTASLPGGPLYTWPDDKKPGVTNFNASTLAPTREEIGAAGATPGGTGINLHHTHSSHGDPDQHLPHEKAGPLGGLRAQSEGPNPSPRDRDLAAEQFPQNVTVTMTNQKGKLVKVGRPGAHDQELEPGLGSAEDLVHGEFGAVTSAKQTMGNRAFNAEVARQKAFLRSGRALLAWEQRDVRPAKVPAYASVVRR